MLKNIFKNFLVLIFSQGLYRLFSFFIFVYAARVLGVAKFGQFSFALYLGLFLYALSDVGIGELYIYDSAGKKESKTGLEIMGIAIGNRIILLLLSFFLLLILCIMFRFDSNSIWLTLFIGISMIVDSQTYFFRCVFRSKERMEYEGISLAFEGFIKMMIVIWVLKIFTADIFMIGLAFLATSVIVLFFTLIMCKKYFYLPKPIFKIYLLFQSFKRGIPFAVISFLSIVSLKIDTVMLARMSTDYITGWYAAAARLIESVLAIPILLATVLFPVITRLYKDSIKSLIKVYKISLLVSFALGLIIFLTLYLSSPGLIRFIFGNSFLNSIIILQILCLIFIPIFPRLFLERVALVIGHPVFLLKAYIGGIALKIILNLLFIPLLEVKGVAFSTLFTELMVVFYIFYRLQSRVRSFTGGPPKGNVFSNLLILLENE